MDDIQKIITCKDNDDAANAALNIVLAAAEAAITARGRFVLVLAGGTTPGLLYQLLAQQQADWRQWILLYGDERCLPRDDAERNSRMVEQCWLEAVNFPEANHYIMPAELGAEVGAERYAAEIAAYLPADLCLLGMGEDGHTASLFPGHPEKSGDVIAVHDSPKPPSDRVSLNYSSINASREICLIVTGAGKKAALKAWREGNNTLPVAHLSGSRTTLIVDEAAQKTIG